MNPDRITILSSVCDIAEEYVKLIEEKRPEYELFPILGVLLDCEHILDSARAIPFPADNETDTHRISVRMDSLREKIIELMKLLGKEKVEQYLQGRARAAQTDFIGAI